MESTPGVEVGHPIDPGALRNNSSPFAAMKMNVDFFGLLRSVACA
jgi:hypothetical protein